MDTLNYFVKRLIAFVIDVFCILILGTLLFQSAKNSTDIAPNVLFSIAGIQFVSHPASIVAGWLYFSILESKKNYQATFGKIAVGLKVVDSEGKKINFGRASIRYLFKILSWILFVISILTILGNPDRKSIHDYLSFTKVVKN